MAFDQALSQVAESTTLAIPSERTLAAAAIEQHLRRHGIMTIGERTYRIASAGEALVNGERTTLTEGNGVYAAWPGCPFVYVTQSHDLRAASNRIAAKLSATQQRELLGFAKSAHA